jgi:hypothetical protein
MLNRGLRNWQKWTNLRIDRTQSSVKIYIVCGVATAKHGRVQKKFASENNFKNKIIFNATKFFFIRSWYDEVKQYTWNAEPRTSFKAAQFSQMVWKSSKELGVGVGRTKNGKAIVVCSYYPRGNIIGQFLNNVRKSN